MKKINVYVRTLHIRISGFLLQILAQRPSNLTFILVFPSADNRCLQRPFQMHLPLVVVDIPRYIMCAVENVVK